MRIRHAVPHGAALYCAALRCAHRCLCVQAAEDVAVKLESELTNARIRATQLEGSVRSRDKDIGQLQVSEDR